MILFRRLTIVFVFALSFASCGGGSSSSGSGIGGTGITLVRGNVSSVDGQLFVSIHPEGSYLPITGLAEWIIPLSYAQSGGAGSLIVSGGGQTTTTNSAGVFELPGVTPSANFVLTFKTDGDSISLGIGEVLNGAVVTVKDIRIDTKSASAKPRDIDVEEPTRVEDDVSEDLKSETETEEEEDEEDDEEDSQDDNSEDDSEERAEDDEDSVDDVSHDDEK